MSRRSGIVNVRMVITEEKILSNIDKVQKLINPKSKKQIVQFDDDTYFKDLVESIKSYLVEYPKKKNFPANVYKAAYELVEYATGQFEENTKKVEELIRQREENIALAGKLKDVVEAVESKATNWKIKVKELEDEGQFSEDVIDTLKLVGKDKTRKSQNYQDAMKLLNARVNNLETNLHIEIDMDRIEDRSKALSYIGIEVAEALKEIPKPTESGEQTAEAEENVAEEIKIPKESIQQATVEEPKVQKATEKKASKKATKAAKIEKVEEIKEQEEIENIVIEPQILEAEQAQSNKSIGELLDQFEENNRLEEYEQSVLFEKKPSLWQKIKKSKLGRAVSYVFKIRIRIELPNALPEGRGESL